jgi:hypothetical protein
MATPPYRESEQAFIARAKGKSCRASAANLYCYGNAPHGSLAQMLERANNPAPQTCKIMRAAVPLGKFCRAQRSSSQNLVNV